MPAFREYGLDFIRGTTWDPNKAQYGILPEIWGTLYTSLLALVIGSAFGVAAAIFLSEYYLGEAVFKALRVFNLQFHPRWRKLPERLEHLLKNLIELLAAVPSVVYGLWGIFVVIPMIRPACNWLHEQFGWLPFFSTNLSGPGILPAVFVSVHHDSADDHGDQPRRAGLRAAEAADGRLRAGRHEVGNHSRRHIADRFPGHIRRHRSWLLDAPSGRRWPWQCWWETPIG